MNWNTRITTSFKLKKNVLKISYGWLIILTVNKWIWTFFCVAVSIKHHEPRWNENEIPFFRYPRPTECHRTRSLWKKMWWRLKGLIMHSLILFVTPLFLTSPKAIQHKTNVFIQFIKRETCWVCGEASEINADPLHIICGRVLHKSSITDAVNLLDFCLIAYETFI